MEAGPRSGPYPEEGGLPQAQLGGGPGTGAPGSDGLGTDARFPGEDGLDAHIPDDVGPGGADPSGAGPDGDGPDEHELRPVRRLRIWQIAPIVALAALGSLMFAFPLAFEFGDGGPVVAMLGLLLSACSAGWGIMVARRVGYTWPGLPRRGSGARIDWRVVAAYAALSLLIALLAIWRVARLNGSGTP